MAGVRAFRESYLTTDEERGEFGDWEARRLRYALLWSYFENTAYRDIHHWAVRMKADYGLYKYTRGLYNPAFRLGDFWRTHLMGGALDPEAGDGKLTPSCLPIIANNDARPALAALWRASNWGINKDIYTLRGAVLGDVGLQVVDDPLRGKVYLKVVDPAIIKEVARDPWGNVKGYTFEERRPDPRRGRSNDVTYREEASRDGDLVVYRTFLDNTPYAWNTLAEWSEPYGFVPLVLVQHYNVGQDWGWAEAYPGLSKIREADDLASKLSDQVRKSVDCAWLFAGVADPRRATQVAGATPTTARPEPGREEVPVFYAADPAAKAQPLVATLDIAATLEHIKALLEELERDFPELRDDLWTVSGEASGRALRVARQQVTAKAAGRRAGYDDALVRAQQMALAIGGFRGYTDFESFDLDSYDAGLLDHSIGERDVFQADPLDDIEVETALWTAAGAAVKAGIPLEMFLQRQGWSQEDIAKVTNSPERQARLKMLQGGLDGLSGSDQGGEGNG